MGWEEKSWDEVRRTHMIWDEMKCGVWSASVKCGARGVKSAVWTVKKVFTWRWRCIAPRSRAGHVLGQQQCTHGACKFYRWKRSYSITVRQLPPRLVRVLLVRTILGWNLSYSYWWMTMSTWQSIQSASHDQHVPFVFSRSLALHAMHFIDPFWMIIVWICVSRLKETCRCPSGNDSCIIMATHDAQQAERAW